MSHTNDLLATYPNVPLAVAWCELFVFDGEDGAFANELRGHVAAGLPLDDLLGILSETMLDDDSPVSAAMRRAAADQTAHADFRRYLAGRLGLV